MKRPQFIVAVVLLGAGAIFVLGFGGFGFARGTTPIEVPLAEFPHEINGWRGTDQPLSKAEMDFIQPDDYLRRSYRRGDEIVNLFISYHGNKLDGLKRVHHNPTICLPAAGWTEQKNHAVKKDVIFTDVAKSIPLSSHYFTNGRGGEFVVTVFFSIDGKLEADHRRPKQEPLKRFYQRTMEAFEGPGWCLQVQVWTPGDGDPRKAYDRTVAFLRDTVAPILRHFPAEVQH